MTANWKAFQQVEWPGLAARCQSPTLPGPAARIDPKLTAMKVSYPEEKSQIGVLLIIDTRNDR